MVDGYIYNNIIVTRIIIIFHEMILFSDLFTFQE